MKKKRRVFNMDLLPAMLLFAIFPVMAKGQLVDNPLDGEPWFLGGSQQYDFFMHWKSVIFLLLVIWMMAVLADRVLLRQKKCSGWKEFLPLAIYAGLVILSTVLSVNKNLSIKGMLEQYETVWVLLGYVVTVFYCCQVTETKKDVAILLGAMCVGAGLQGIIGLFQAVGVEFWDTAIGKALITIGLDASIKERLIFTFSDSESNKVYMASYNPNYAGVYIILVLPLILICVKMAVKKWQKVTALVLGLLLTVCLVASGSKMGFLVAAILLLLVPVLSLTADKRKKIAAVMGFLAVVVVCVLVYDLAGGHRLSKALARSAKKGKYILTDLQPQEDGVNVEFRKKNLHISLVHTEYGDIVSVMEGEEEIPVVWNEKTQRFVIDREGYKGISFDAYQQDGCDYVIIERNDVFWQFVKEKEDSVYVYVNPYGNRHEINHAETVFAGYERALSGRGYIWGRTIPLLKKSLIWGTGPDTFAVVFPQDDYLARFHAGITLFAQVRSKAHNMYLQTALQTGVVSLICLLVFVGKILMQLWRERKRNHILYAGMILAITGYLLMGLLNDSVVAVAPIFWGIVGVGMALKRITE